MEKFLTTVKEKKHLTLNTVELTVSLVLPHQIKFKAGQFMQFEIGQDLRSYSIIIPPDHNDYLKFCVGLVEGGVGTEFVKKLNIGDDLVMQGPNGSMVVENSERSLFFVATGVGIAPFASIIPDLLSNQYSKPMHLVFGLRHEDEVFYYSYFGGLAARYPNFTFTPLLSQPKAHWPGQVGRVTTYIDERYQKHKDDVFYICGRPDMVKDVRSVLLKNGHAVGDIKAEIFT